MLGGLDKSGLGIGPDRGRRSGDDDGYGTWCDFATGTSGFVFQFHHLLPEFTALENAEMPMRIAGRHRRSGGPATLGLLGRVGLGERVEHKPGMLSGGEQQRVALARALVMRPSAAAGRRADREPGRSTPPKRFTDLLREMHREQGLTSIIATHNPRLAATCDRVLRLAEGRLHPE